MATWDDVRRLALALPAVTERTSRGSAQWHVRDKLFVWDRPLHKPDLAALGAAAPTGPILGARVPELDTKDVLITADPAVYFTIPHFTGYPAILVLLDEIKVEDLEELILEAWLCRAPKKLAKEYLDSLG